MLWLLPILDIRFKHAVPREFDFHAVATGERGQIMFGKKFKQLRAIFRGSVTFTVQSFVTSVARNPIEL